jgi:UTP:GlnB (protein PII) uridylyltransferase
MSEISALLTEMRCNVVAAELWTHNMRAACLLYITDEVSNGPIEENERLCRIKDSLCNVMRGHQSSKGARTDFATILTHTERRLHQMMFADRDYEGGESDEQIMWDLDAKISVEDCNEKGYSVLNVQCKNRPKLLFDALCTLTDMEYVIFHATIDTDGHRAFQVCIASCSPP